MATTTAELIFERVKVFPEPVAREVLDFVAFLQSRLERRKDVDLMEAQAATLNTIWDNAEDGVWDIGSGWNGIRQPTETKLDTHRQGVYLIRQHDHKNRGAGENTPAT